MKIQGQNYEIMKTAVSAVVNHLGAPVVKAAILQSSQDKILWQLWAAADNNLRYDDAHPGFAKKHWTRVTPQVPNFDLYADDVNDAHILTALRKIAKELGLI